MIMPVASEQSHTVTLLARACQWEPERHLNHHDSFLCQCVVCTLNSNERTPTAGQRALAQHLPKKDAQCTENNYLAQE